MRRHHFLSLRDTESPPDSISLLIGAEADQRRRRSTQIPPSPARDMPRRLHSVFGGVVPGETDTDASPAQSDDTSHEDEEEASDFLGRVHSYSRLMHAHTRSQLARPATGTLPGYNKTMHAFTLNQLKASETQSERSSPQMAGVGSAALQVELGRLVLDAVPPAPGNSPEIAGRVGGGEERGESHVHGIDWRKLKRRSVTDPEMVRRAGASAVRVRDFAAA